MQDRIECGRVVEAKEARSFIFMRLNSYPFDFIERDRI